MLRLSISLALISIVTPRSTWSQDAFDTSLPVLGETHAYGQSSPANFFGDGPLFWTHTVDPGVPLRFLRLRLRVAALAKDAIWFALVRDEHGDVWWRIRSTDLVSAGWEEWSPQIPSSKLTIELYADRPPDGLRLEISDYLRSVSQVVPHQFFGPNNLQDFRDLPPSDLLVKPGNAVGLLRFLKMSGGRMVASSCTGFLVSRDLFITNEHCVASASACNTAAVEFGYLRPDSAPQGVYACERFEGANWALDYSILRLGGAPGEDYPMLRLDPGAPPAGADLAIVQHPGGEHKQVAVIDCSLTSLDVAGRPYPVKSDFGHRCDTKDGSSGSPVFDQRRTVVVGLHHGTAQRNGTLTNLAVASKHILADIQANYPMLASEIDGAGPPE